MEIWFCAWVRWVPWNYGPKRRYLRSIFLYTAKAFFSVTSVTFLSDEARYIGPRAILFETATRTAVAAEADSAEEECNLCGTSRGRRNLELGWLSGKERAFKELHDESDW